MQTTIPAVPCGWHPFFTLVSYLLGKGIYDFRQTCLEWQMESQWKRTTKIRLEVFLLCFLLALSPLSFPSHSSLACAFSACSCFLDRDWYPAEFTFVIPFPGLVSQSFRYDFSLTTSREVFMRDCGFWQCFQISFIFFCWFSLLFKVLYDKLIKKKQKHLNYRGTDFYLDVYYFQQAFHICHHYTSWITSLLLYLFLVSVQTINFSEFV